MLVAEGGSTKLDIAIRSSEVNDRFQLPGINPFYQTVEQMIALLRDTKLSEYAGSVACEDVFYYGAGCANPDKNQMIREVISAVIGAKRVEVESDLLAAARGTAGRKSGIIAILGTGSNSCYYDGERMVHNVPSLGFMLGDEGSGAYMGKRLVSDVLKGVAPQSVRDAFETEYHLTQAEIVERVYRQPFPNRYLASFAAFLARHREAAYVRDLVTDSMREFYKRNVTKYDEYGCRSVSFVGGIAYEFEQTLRSVSAEFGYDVHEICKSPMEGLLRFHALGV